MNEKNLAPAEASTRREMYRDYIKSLNLSQDGIDDLIDIVHAILSHFVDHAFGVQTDQITLESVGKDFDTALDRAMIAHHPHNQSIAVHNGDAESDPDPLELSQP